MSESDVKQEKVIVRRFPDNYTVVGPPTYLRSLENAAEDLAISGFMLPWITKKIVEALRSGEVFRYFKQTVEEGQWRGRPDHLVAEYAMASDEDMQRFTEAVSFIETTNGKEPARKVSSKQFKLCYQSDPDLIERYAVLPRQAKIILDALNKTGKTMFSESEVEEIVATDAIVEALNTRQPPMRIFAFYRSRYARDGHIQVIDK